MWYCGEPLVALTLYLIRSRFSQLQNLSPRFLIVCCNVRVTFEGVELVYRPLCSNNIGWRKKDIIRWLVKRLSALGRPEKPFVKLRPAYSVKLVFSYVAKGWKIKIIGWFRDSGRLRFKDPKKIMSREMPCARKVSGLSRNGPLGFLARKRERNNRLGNTMHWVQ